MRFLHAPDGRLRPGWRFALAVLVVIVAQLSAATLASLLAGGDQHAFDALFRPLWLAFLVGGFAVLLINADGVSARPLAAMGLGRTRNWRRDAALGLGIGAGMMMFVAVALATLGELSLVVTLSGQTVMLALLQLWILATGAMAEEAAFRGYPFHRLLEALGAAVAVVMLSALFAALHLANPHATMWSWGFFNTAAVGALFAIAYLRTRALWLPWGIHFAWNAMLGVGLGLPVSGLRQFNVMVQAEAAGPDWLTGGSYGPEDSATATAAIVLGLAAVLWFTRRHPTAAAGTHLPEGYLYSAAPVGIQTEERDGEPAR